MTGPNPTDRGKLGTKRHVLTDKKGIPLSVVITAANTHDMKAANEILDSIIVVKRPLPRKIKQNLCLDKGYDFPEIQHEIINRGYIPHIRHKGEKKKKSFLSWFRSNHNQVVLTYSLATMMIAANAAFALVCD